jgi:hypothetical protein
LLELDRLAVTFPKQLVSPQAINTHCEKKSFENKGLSYPSEKKMTFYNCNEANYFPNKCSYDKREDKPKYKRAAMPRLKLNPVN